MIKVTKQQLVDYINEQPDERVINFDESCYNAKCGCLMIHYARDNKFTPALDGVGMTTFHDTEIHVLDDFMYNVFLSNEIVKLQNRITNYGELKKWVSSEDFKSLDNCRKDY